MYNLWVHEKTMNRVYLLDLLMRIFIYAFYNTLNPGGGKLNEKNISA